MAEKPTQEFHKFLQEKKSNIYERISPTAWSVAYRRTFSDIPYSQEIFEEMEKIRVKNGDPELPKELKTPEISPQLEARYKLVNNLLRETGAEQIIEVASGFSPRGLELSSNKNIEFVEVDLAGIMSQKQKIATAIKNEELPSNLHLEVGNALDLASLETAIKYFKSDKPIAVVNEGLMRYLNFEQKSAYAKNVHSLLKRFGGVWITPDITLKGIMDRENAIAKNKNKRIKKITGINIDLNCFENVDQAQEFFENLGFTIERHNFLEVVNELASPQRIGLPREEVEATLKPTFVFVMRAK